MHLQFERFGLFLDHRLGKPCAKQVFFNARDGAPLSGVLGDEQPLKAELSSGSLLVHWFSMLTNKLGRIIAGGKRFIAEVDGLRFVAIMAVVFFHLSGYTLAKHMAGATIYPAESWIPKVLSLGHYGVQLFFVLSGFLLALPFAKWRLGLGTKPSLRKYYLRRLTRLEPPYIVSMLLLFAGGLIVVGLSAGLARWPNLLASLVYQHNLIYGKMSLVNIVAWSLEIEVQFYVLAPFLAVMFSIRGTILRRIVLSAVMILVPLLRDSFSPHLPQSLPLYLEFFIAGFLLADFFLVDWREAPEHSFRWDIASLAGWSLVLALMLWEWQPILIAPAILLAYAGAFRGRASNWLFTRPLMTVIGGMCYSMYLLHYSVISITGRFATRFLWGASFTSRLAVEALFAIPAILAITGIFFIVLERPCMDPSWPFKVSQRVSAWFASDAGGTARVPAP